MEDLKQQFKEKLLSIGREGMEAVIENLEELGFFEAPASTNFHLNVKRGLMEHSWNVCNTALMLREQMIHMTAWDLAFQSPEQRANLQKAREIAPLCVIVQCADGLSTSLLEV